MADPVIVENHGPVAVVTLNRPDVLNALSPEMATSLRETMYSIESDKAVRSVVI